MKIIEILATPRFTIILLSLILLSTVVIIGDYLYDWRDLRYEKTQEQLIQLTDKAKTDSTVLAQRGEYLASVLQQVAKGQAKNVQYVSSINQVLVNAGYAKYQVKIDTSKGK